jgi:hypothetical protein
LEALQNRWIGHEQVITDQLDFVAQDLGQIAPTIPIGLV